MSTISGHVVANRGGPGRGGTPSGPLHRRIEGLARGVPRAVLAPKTEATTSAPAPSVEFRIAYGTAFGESVKLVGGSPEFGAWVPAAGVALKWSEGNVWSATMPMEPGHSFEFKVVVFNSGTGASKWEVGDNRVAAIDSPGVYLMDMAWNQIPGTGLVKVADIAVPGPVAETAPAASPAASDASPVGSADAATAETAQEEEPEAVAAVSAAAASDTDAGADAPPAANAAGAAAAAEQPAPGATATGETVKASPASSEGYYQGMLTSDLSQDNGASADDMLGRNLSLAAGVTVLLAAGVAAFLASNGLLELPTLPAVGVPSIRLPDVDMSQYGLPDLVMPDLSAFAIPALPKVSLPEVSLPPMPDMPSMPTMPTLPEMPAMPQMPSLPALPALPALPEGAPEAAGDAARDTAYALPAKATSFVPKLSCRGGASRASGASQSGARQHAGGEHGGARGSTPGACDTAGGCRMF
ncbi:hypothetical protein FOA52_002001 [Chlamydomonas sp. UWO 241]|nr:hypothetical protein FOA52_002001 [Chlamydomonas sp. UWO 241]